ILNNLLRLGENFQLQGKVEALSRVELYLWNPKEKHIYYPLGSLKQSPKQGSFTLEFKNPGFLEKESYLVALTQSPGKNTSVFSEAIAFPLEKTESTFLSKTPQDSPPAQDSNTKQKENNLETKIDEEVLHDEGLQEEREDLEEQAAHFLDRKNTQEENQDLEPEFPNEDPDAGSLEESLEKEKTPFF
ncbi:MAG: hypothetical protein KDK66_07450, partial [Deltaproteobacteria bacterium]|nr:hypothetical protein [Deltaproteobacteria bacterium]